MSGSELSALALFFTTSASFPCTIIFDHVEGFSVSASVVDNTNVALELKADAQILKFMGIEDSSEVINITLNIQQLDQLARKILHSTTLCN
jgi:predicted ATP-grasp superfamily ATP-dependent carboligase